MIYCSECKQPIEEPFELVPLPEIGKYCARHKQCVHGMEKFQRIDKEDS